MNTNALKRFAQEARRKLLQQVGAKLEYVLTHDTAELREKAAQIKTLQEELKRVGKSQLIEKVAYTWFNRLMALRFMDANDYQPAGIRIVSPKEGFTLPQLLDEAKQGHFPEEISVDRQRVLDILDGRVPSSNPQNEAFRYLLIAACNALHRQFPFLFERINDYTELLLPDDLTSEFSIVHDVVAGMTAADCVEVEIIGWLYQFYISEKKDEVFAAKGKVKKEDIPAATQLFTPRWIVEYMVQNTLGKLWLQNRPSSRLRDHMPYFIESPSLEATDFLKVNSVEDIKLLDQACGSGHILVYAFELLARIYEEEGYSASEIPQFIIEKNLYGFEIDERAAQLAGLALMMKARSYYRRLFRKHIKPHILCFQDVRFEGDELPRALTLSGIDLSDTLKHDLQLISQATNFGSLIQPHTDAGTLSQGLMAARAAYAKADVFDGMVLEKLQSALSQLLLLKEKVHCVVDNPPYMGGGNMNKALSDFVKRNYPDSKSDLMTCFMESGIYMLEPQGFLGMINLPSWLFLASFEKFRKKLIINTSIDSLLHMGRGIFGIDWGSTAFIIRNEKNHSSAKYFKLHKRNFQHLNPEDIRDIFLKAKKDSTLRINFDKYREGERIATIDELVDENGIHITYTANQRDFEKIPGSPIGYWLSEKFLKLFDEDTINDYSQSDGQTKTGYNERFLRFHWEISCNKFGKGAKWVSHPKGGSFRRWFGNLEMVIDWSPSSRNHYRRDHVARILPEKWWWKKGISWSDVSSGKQSFRDYDENSIFNLAAPTLFIQDENIRLYILGLLNSNLIEILLKLLNPTIHCTITNVQTLPLKISNTQEINNMVIQNLEICRKEWNSREISWDFLQNELIRINGQDLEESYDLYRQFWTNKFHQLHRNEEELNQQFIEIYGLQDELTPDVPLEEITILKEETSIHKGELVFDAKEVFAQFLSYAVGCMMGRYSLDKEGLILANQEENLQDYLKKLEKPQDQISFLPDDDAIIPILDDEWFEDDIVGRFYEFLKVTFGTKDFSKNLSFLEEQLGKDVRKYFVKDFYNDHIKRYKKRPIYWLFSSPGGAFNVLVYLHRYTPDTINNILNNYLREFIQKLKSQKVHLEKVQGSGSAAEQNKATKQIDQLDRMILDCEAYERDILYPLATERIAIDLDDGVLVNYNKFGKAMKEVKGLNDKKTKEKVRKFDWIDVEAIRD